MRKLYSLERLSENYKIILPDTSAILSALSQTHLLNNPLMKSYSFWKICIIDSKNAQFLFHEEIYVEIGKGGKIKSNKKEFNKMIREGTDYTISEDKFIGFAKSTKFSYDRKRELLKQVDKRGLVLKLNISEKEFFNAFHKKYFFLMEQFDLSDPDYSLLLSGLTLSYTRCDSSKMEKLALISNDSGIFKSWKFLLNENDCLKDSFHFYNREEFDGFKRMYF